MKIQCWSVGKTHEPYIKTGVADFTRRIANYYPVEWNIFAPVKDASGLSAAELKKREAALLMVQLKKDDYLVALDENGKQFNSLELASLIQARANDSTRQLIFLIGGAYGLSDEIMQKANTRWSLSRLTFPHQLVRLLLAEQLYRACSINRNEKYHHR